MKYIKLFEEKYQNFDLMTMGSNKLIELLKLEIEKEDYDIEYIREIIEWGHFDIDVLWEEHDEQWSFLIKASYLGRVDIIKALLDGGADPNLQDEYGWTALIYAVWYGHTLAVQELLKHPDIDPNLQNNRGSTALILAARWERTEEVHELLSHPAIDISLTDNNGRTAWDVAEPQIRKQFPQLNPNRK